MFKNFKNSAIMSILMDIKQIEVPKGQIIYKEGDNPDNVYFLYKGSCSLSLIHSKPKKYDESHKLYKHNK